MSLPLKTCSDGEPTASALFRCSVILRKLPNFELPFWRFGSRSPLPPPPTDQLSPRLGALRSRRRRLLSQLEPSHAPGLSHKLVASARSAARARGLSRSSRPPPSPGTPLSRCSPPSSTSPRNVHKFDNFRPFPNPAAQCARSPPQLCPHGWGLCTPCTPTAPTGSNPGRPGPVHRGAAAALTPRRCGCWEPEPEVGALTGGWGLS